MDWIKSAASKAGEMAGAAAEYASEKAEEHQLAEKMAAAKVYTKEKYAEKLGRDPDADYDSVCEKASNAASSAATAATAAAEVAKAKAAELDEKHAISQKLDQTGDKIVATYDEKTGRSYQDDKQHAKENASSTGSSIASFFGELGAAAAEGYSKSRPSNSTESGAIEGEDAPPSYDEICASDPVVLPQWCDESAFTECFTVCPLNSQEELFKICLNLVTRFGLRMPDGNLPRPDQIEDICDTRNALKEPFLTSEALMHWFCADSQFGLFTQGPLE